MSFELSPNTRASQLEGFQTHSETFERFQSAETKIAIQKDGELTDISKYILETFCGIEVPVKGLEDRKLISVSEDGEYGFAYVRNKNICQLVGKGAVDMAVVGTDRLIEDGAEEEVDIIDTYEDKFSWPLVLASRIEKDIPSLSQVQRVATQYPVITQRYFEQVGAQDIEVIPTIGSTELFPYLDYEGEIDAIVDMSITGASLEAQNLTAWSPAIAEIYPVLIRTKGDVGNA
jgi:ATP phosphoribosyltransferase